MQTQDPRSTVRAYVSAFNEGRFEDLRVLFTPDATVHGVTGEVSLDEAIPFWESLHRALGAKLEIEELVGEGQTVAVRLVERGRWVGPWMGREDPTGLTFELRAMEWFHFRDGKVRHRWGVRDSASQARQIGLTS